jgi:hypothetical protein
MDLDDVLARRRRLRRHAPQHSYTCPSGTPPYVPVLAATAGLSRPGESSKGDKTMCDYSLMHLPNRLAADGEVLMTHKFPNGSVGLASPEEVQTARAAAIRSRHGIRSLLRSWFGTTPKLPGFASLTILAAAKRPEPSREVPGTSGFLQLMANFFIVTLRKPAQIGHFRITEWQDQAGGPLRRHYAKY